MPQLITPEEYRRRTCHLRAAQPLVPDARLANIKRAVRDTLENPNVARAVARGLRLQGLSKL